MGSKTEDKARFAPDVENTFTEDQTVSKDSPKVFFHDTVSTDKLWAWHNYLGAMYLSHYLDDGTWQSNKIQVHDDADQLKLDGTSLSYAGIEIPREGRANTFTATQTYKSTVAQTLVHVDQSNGDTSDNINYGLKWRTNGAADRWGMFGNENGASAGKFLLYDYAAASYVLTLNSGAVSIETTSDDVTADGNSIRSYAGRVNSAGVALSVPTGWTTSRPATGQFRVTHNLGVCVPTVNVESTGAAYVATVAVAANLFDIYIKNLSGTASNVGFSFHAQRV